jgi:hypothetical protein
VFMRNASSSVMIGDYRKRSLRGEREKFLSLVHLLLPVMRGISWLKRAGLTV